MSDSDFLNYLRILDRWKRFIIGIVATAALLSMVASFFLPKWYAARSTLIPPQEGDIGALASLVQGMSLPGLGGLAAAGGESQLFLAILDSRTLRKELIDKYQLMSVYKVKTLDDAIKAHSRLARAALTDLGVVEVVVEDRDPRRAADMANDWVAGLDRFNKNARMTAGKKSRLFIEGRIEETGRALASAESLLTTFQETHKSLSMTASMSAAVESGASLMARRMALQVQLNLASDLYKSGTPQVQRIESELAALDRQLGTLPELGLDFARLLRDVKVQEQVQALLMAQYEEAKIRENRDTPTLEVLDNAVPPDRRIRPIRWLFCTSITLAALILSLGTAFGIEFLGDIRRRLAGTATRHPTGQ